MDQTQSLKDLLKSVNEKIKEAESLAKNTDESMKELIKEEIDLLNSQKEQLENSIKTIEGGFESNKNSNDSGSSNTGDVIMEIRAGAGGDEAGLFAKNLDEMYTKFAQLKGWKVEKISDLSFEIHGKKSQSPTPFDLLENESGVHRVQRIPITESGGRIHTSTATVAVLPIVTAKEVEIKPEDLKIDTFRSSGAGGQHVNKTESAIRITHIPTGVVASCQEERSQHKNREKAMSALRSKIYEIMQRQQKGSVDEIRAEQVGTGDRSEKIRTYNFPQDRITDHRVKKSWHNMENRLNGEIEDILKEIRTTLQAHQE